VPLKSFTHLATDQNAVCSLDSFQYAALAGIISTNVGMYGEDGEAKEARYAFLSKQICHVAHALT
jgi:hypothetical protein